MFERRNRGREHESKKKKLMRTCEDSVQFVSDAHKFYTLKQYIPELGLHSMHINFVVNFFVFRSSARNYDKSEENVDSNWQICWIFPIWFLFHRRRLSCSKQNRFHYNVSIAFRIYELRATDWRSSNEWMGLNTKCIATFHMLVYSSLSSCIWSHFFFRFATSITASFYTWKRCKVKTSSNRIECEINW